MAPHFVRAQSAYKDTRIHSYFITHTHIHTPRCTCAHTQTHTYSPRCTCTHTQTHTHTHTKMHVRTHPITHTHTKMHMRTHPNTHTHTHTPRCTCTHTQTHTPLGYNFALWFSLCPWLSCIHCSFWLLHIIHRPCTEFYSQCCRAMVLYMV